VLLWALDDPHRLDPDARNAIVEPENDVLVSAASIFEISIKRSIGKLKAPDDLPAHARAAGFESLAVTWEHADRVGRLPLHHRDPFDRLLIAQAQTEGLTIATRDARIGAYDVEVLES
jgi:PIN domain nuclease of toxin-antitoxin system